MFPQTIKWIVGAAAFSFALSTIVLLVCSAVGLDIELYYLVALTVAPGTTFALVGMKNRLAAWASLPINLAVALYMAFWGVCALWGNCL
ncbi:MAG: hypothetical protein EP335_15600 [Alphaproteobacteria bacterium]|nr:MAG: hypothetical protein EP335_15600 [Alphaproteobacteria bacterium]